MIIKKLKIEDWSHKKELYSKEIRGGFSFYIEPHILDKGKEIRIHLFRKEEEGDIKDLAKDWADNGELNRQSFERKDTFGILKLSFGDKEILINNDGEAKISVKEYNYAPAKEKKVKKGKVAIAIVFELSQDFGNNNIRSDIKKILEDNNE